MTSEFQNVPITLPQRDANGFVSAHDHSEIMSDHVIIRRISSDHIVPDEKAPTGHRVSSLAFDCSSDGNKSMSVDIEFLILEDKIDPRAYVKSPPFTGAVYFSAGELRSEEFQVGYDPIVENPYHGGVWGRFTRSKKKRLLKAARWYVEIIDVDLNPAT